MAQSHLVEDVLTHVQPVQFVTQGEGFAAVVSVFLGVAAQIAAHQVAVDAQSFFVAERCSLCLKHRFKRVHLCVAVVGIGIGRQVQQGKHAQQQRFEVEVIHRYCYYLSAKILNNLEIPPPRWVENLSLYCKSTHLGGCRTDYFTYLCGIVIIKKQNRRL